MNVPNTQLSDQTPETESRSRNFSRFINTVIWLDVFLIPFYLYLGFQRNAWQLFALIGLAGVLIFAGLVSKRLQQKSRLVAAVWLQIIILQITTLTIILLLSGLGEITAVIVTIILVQIAGQTLPPKQVPRAILYSAAVGVALFLLELYVDFSTQLEIPEIQFVVPVLGGAIILVNLYFILRQFRSYSLRTKLILATLVIGFVGVTTTIFIAQRNAATTITQNAGSTLVRVLNTQSTTVGEILLRQENAFKALAASTTLQIGLKSANASYLEDPEAIRTMLERLDERWVNEEDTSSFVQSRLNNLTARELVNFQRLYPANQDIFVTDKNGALVAATNRTTDFYFADQEWWQEAVESEPGQFAFGAPEFDANRGILKIILALPVYDERDSSNLIGVLYTNYILTDLLQALSITDLGESGEVALLLPTGQLLSIKRLTVTPLSEESLSQLETIGNNRFAEIEFEEQPSLVSQTEVRTVSAPSSTVNELNMRLIARQDIGAIAALVEAQRQPLILGGIFVLAAVAAAAAYFSQIFSTPIIRLTNSARKVAAGDLTVRANVENEDEIGVLAEAFNEMTVQLEQTLGVLEQRITDRTVALAASAEVSRSLSTILDLDQLTREVVEQVRSAFDYYHTQIYLFDDQRENLMMVGGTGEAGQAMLANEHKVPKETGIVGRAATTGRPVLIANVAEAEEWLPNPLLPDTKAEIAVPIISGGQVAGVLDVQHDIVGGLDQDDADLLESIANQVSIVLQNARLYQRAQRQADREALINAIGQKIQRTNTIEDVLKTAARELGQALSVSKTGVQLGE